MAMLRSDRSRLAMDRKIPSCVDGSSCDVIAVEVSCDVIAVEVSCDVIAVGVSCDVIAVNE